MARVLITGAGRGIGRATAVEATRRGHEVFATARNPEDLAELDGVAARLELDVMDQGSVDAAVRTVGQLDALISNAGGTVRGSVEGTPLSEIQRLFELNTLGAIRVTQRIVPLFRAQKSGRLLFVSSVLGRIAMPLSGAYAASKWALEALAETLAHETADFGIRVTLLEPGMVSTGAAQVAPNYLTKDDPYLQLLRNRKPPEPNTVITPEHAAATIVDALESSEPPLRVPVGTAAEFGLADWRSEPVDRPFLWQPRICSEQIAR